MIWKYKNICIRMNKDEIRLVIKLYLHFYSTWVFFPGTQQLFWYGEKVFSPNIFSTEILPWPLTHPTTIHLTADTGVPLGCSFAFCGIISHLERWFRQMLDHDVDLPSVAMLESIFQMLQIHFWFIFELQTTARQQKKPCNSLSKSKGQDGWTKNMQPIHPLKALR